MDATRKLQKVSFWRFSLMARMRMLFARFFEQNSCNSLIIILPDFIHRLKTHFYQYISCLCVDQRQASWLAKYIDVLFLCKTNLGWRCCCNRLPICCSGLIYLVINDDAVCRSGFSRVVVSGSALPTQSKEDRKAVIQTRKD